MVPSCTIQSPGHPGRCIRIADNNKCLEPRPVGAELPEECHILMHSALFPTFLHDVSPTEPGFDAIVDWSQRPATNNAMYAFHRRALQVLAEAPARRGGAPSLGA
jgi:hypothetical protein